MSDGHTFVFEEFDNNFKGILTRQDVIDTIDLLYDGLDSMFLIVGKDSTSGQRGSCTELATGEIKITLDLPTIREHVEKGLRMGGNLPHEDLKKACLSVLAHETQHANQFRRHKHNRIFWAGSYFHKPCERDARHFADVNDDIISNIIDFKCEVKEKPERTSTEIVAEIIDVFSELDSVTKKEIISELRANDAYNPVNYRRVVTGLKRNKTKVEE